MAAKRYAVYYFPDPRQASFPFECRAESAVAAIGEYEKHLHGRRQPRKPVPVRVYRPPRQMPATEPEKGRLASGVIEPAPFKVRFHPPEAGRPDDGVQIRFEVDGRPSGSLVEMCYDRDGGRSGWYVASREPEFEEIAFKRAHGSLTAACGAVQEAAARARGNLRDDRDRDALPGRDANLPAPERATGIER